MKTRHVILLLFAVMLIASTVSATTTVIPGVYRRNLVPSVLSQDTWAVKWNAAGATATDTVIPEIVAGLVADRYTTILRPAITFNTSVIPDTDTVTSAVLSLSCDAVTNDDFASDIDIVSFNPANTRSYAVAEFDHSYWGEDPFASKDISLMGAGYQNFTLDADGRLYINKTSDTVLGVRISKDADNVAPTWAGSGTDSVVFSSTAADHFLTITHSCGNVTTQAAMDVTAQSAELRMGVNNADTVWFEYGIVSGVYPLRSEDSVQSPGVYAKTIAGSYITPGETFYYRAACEACSGEEMSFTADASTPVPTRTFSTYSQGFQAARFNLSALVPIVAGPYTDAFEAIGVPSVFFYAIVWLFIFVSLWTRQENMSIPIVLFILLMPIVAFSSILPGMWIYVSYLIIAVSIGALIYLLFKGRG